MTTCLVAVHLLIEVENNPEAEIGDALHGILTHHMRKYAGSGSPLIDWAVAGEDVPGSFAPVTLTADYVPDETPFPPYPAGTGSTRYSPLEMEAALCVWEHFNDIIVCTDKPDPDWMAYREGVGSAELRHESIAIGRWALQVYDLLPQWYRECGAYDWEIIPAIVGTLTPGQTSRDPQEARDAIVNSAAARAEYFRAFDADLERLYGIDVEQGLGLDREAFERIWFQPDVEPHDQVVRIAEKLDLEAIR